ncbi:MAG: alkaline phosphatase [Saprospiraceae bacterium]|nr:alkaline phosphatase [Bacteroidia bacterium]NNF21895.1 alkaline phosphatase [Saprospiraceae bacterium]
MNKSIILFVLFSFLISCKTNQAITPETKPLAKNIILFIGDGMGIGQITGGTFANNNYSSLERFPVTGLHKPYASDSLITDSAAGATSFACGIKTYYNAIGVGPDSLPRQTILEEAEMKGLKTGLVATSTIVHATPASFIAHNISRRNYEEIAEDFLKTDVEFLVGGGMKFFNRREKDERNLVEELESKGYVVKNYLEDFVNYKDELMQYDKFIYFSADNSPLTVEQGRDYLADASISGVKFLDSKADKGFFIMVEGSQIDWGGHANNTNWIISEFKDFSETIGKLLDWAEADGETLVVVTADHETGGFTIQPGSTMDSLVTAFTTTNHSGDFIPVFAFGPGSEYFSGIYENYEIYYKMRKAMGWK